MSHNLITVNNQNPDASSNISSGISPLKFFSIGHNVAYDFTLSGVPTYPRVMAANDEYLYPYASSNYYFDSIGVTINNYTTGWAKSFTIPAGAYICQFSIITNSTFGVAAAVGAYLTDGTTRFSGSVTTGRGTYGAYHNQKISTSTRFSVASSTTIYVEITGVSGTNITTGFAGVSNFFLIKEP